MPLPSRTAPHIGRSRSKAPLTIRRMPSPYGWTLAMYCCSEANGITARRGWAAASCSAWRPSFKARVTRAPSVGSPVSRHWPAHLLQMGLAAEESRLRELDQSCTVAALDWPAVQTDLAVGRVAGTAHRDIGACRSNAAHGHLVAGKSAGLVSADDAHRAQSLNRRQMADNGVAPRHPLDAYRQAMVITAGRPSGMAATAIPTAARNISWTG